MKYALIDPRSNRVCEVGDACFDVAAPLFWVPVDPDVTTNYTWANGVVSPPKVRVPIVPSPGTSTF